MFICNSVRGPVSYGRGFPCTRSVPSLWCACGIMSSAVFKAFAERHSSSYKRSVYTHSSKQAFVHVNRVQLTTNHSDALTKNCETCHIPEAKSTFLSNLKERWTLGEINQPVAHNTLPLFIFGRSRTFELFSTPEEAHVQEVSHEAKEPSRTRSTSSLHE